LRAYQTAVVLLVLAGCSTADSTGEPVTALSNRSFEVPLANPEDCPADPVINCTSDLLLCEDGSSILLFTDVVNTGTYEQTGSRIVTSWRPGDIPPQIVFTVQRDGTLNDDLFGLTWQPVAEGDFDSFCGPIDP